MVPTLSWTVHDTSDDEGLELENPLRPGKVLIKDLYHALVAE
jgi:hypothetical protein